MKYLFEGGVMDGQEFGEDSGLAAVTERIKVPVKNGKHYSYPGDVVLEYQTYVRNGEMFTLES